MLGLPLSPEVWQALAYGLGFFALGQVVSLQSILDAIFGTEVNLSTLISDVQFTIDENEGELNAALAAVATDVKGQVTGEADRVIRDVSTIVGAAEGIILLDLEARTQQVIDQILVGQETVLAGVAEESAVIQDTVASARDSILASIDSALDGLAPTIETSLAILTEQTAANVQTLIENIETTEGVLGTASTFLQANESTVWTWVTSIVTAGMLAGSEAAITSVGNSTPAEVGDLMGSIANAECLPGWLRGLATAVQGHPTLSAIVIGLAMAIFGLQPAIGVLLEPPLECLRQIVWALQPIRLLPIGDLALAKLRGELTQAEYYEELGKAGYGVRWADLLSALQFKPLGPPELLRAFYRGQLDYDAFALELSKQGVDASNTALLDISSRPLLDPLELRNAYLRGELSLEAHDAKLREFGYTQDLIDLRKVLYFFVPPPQDLIRMAVREAFDPAQVESLDLDLEFPVDFGTFAAQQGINEDWAHKYWQAHWELPSPSQAFEMLHRGQITEEELAALLKAADYAPKWRDKLQAIAYVPFTRVDIRRMHKQGVLDDEAVLAAYQAIGYDKENAQLLLDFTVALNTEEQEAAIEPFRATLKSKAQTYYADGVLTEGGLREVLTALGYSDGQTDAFIAEGQFIRAGERGQAVRTSLRKLYVDGRYDREQTAEALALEGFGQVEADELLSRWDLDKLYKDLTPEEIKTRDLTKAEILAAYRERLITGEEVVIFLGGLGYDENEIAVLVALADLQVVTEEQRAKRDLIRAQFLRGLITRGEASGRLDGLELRVEHRDALLNRWEVEKIKEGRPLPLSVIQGLFKGKAITQGRTLELLLALGWSEDIALEAIRLWVRGAVIA